VDPARRERVRDDLKGVLRGELLFDDLSRALYSTDASIFEVRPLGVAVPRDEEDAPAPAWRASRSAPDWSSTSADTSVPWSRPPPTPSPSSRA
jgi:hypothetical protein